MSFGKARDLLQLAFMATGSVGVTLGEVEEEFGCDRRTAQRMVAALTDLLPTCERWVDGDRRPRWRVRAAAVSALLAPSPDELAVIGTAAMALERDGAASEAGTLRSLAAKVRALVPMGSERRIAVDEEAMLEALGLAARPGPRPATNAMIDEALAIALKGRRRLSILYRSRADAAAKWRSVAPHGLLLGARRYLVALDMAKPLGGMRYYRVEDVHEAKLEDAYFEPLDGFDIVAQARRGFGSYEAADDYGPVEWRFTPAAASHARRYLFHPDQTTEDGDDGSFIVRFEASGHLEMCWHLYMWGDAVEVLGPPALAAMVAGARRGDFAAFP